MALTEPARMIGIHLSTPEVGPYLGPGSAPLSPDEQAYLDHVAGGTRPSGATARSSRPGRRRWATASTTPRSGWPRGWWRSGGRGATAAATSTHTSAATPCSRPSPSTGPPGRSPRRCATTSTTAGTASAIGPSDRVRVPTAMAVFANEFVPEGEPPRSLYERLYSIDPLDRLPARRALRRSRGARPARGRHQSTLQRSLTPAP